MPDFPDEMSKIVDNLAAITHAGLEGSAIGRGSEAGDAATEKGEEESITTTSLSDGCALGIDTGGSIGGEALLTASLPPRCSVLDPTEGRLEHKRTAYLRVAGENVFRSASTSSLHLDDPQRPPHRNVPRGEEIITGNAELTKLGTAREMQVMQTQDDGGPLTPVEVQAMGAFVPMFNNRHYDNVAPLSASISSVTDETRLETSHPELRRRRTWTCLLLGRDEDSKKLDKAAPEMNLDGANLNPQLKKRSSLFLRILAPRENPFPVLVPRTNLYLNPKLVTKVSGYFGTRIVDGELLAIIKYDSEPTLTHHPINPYILLSRQKKEQRKQKCHPPLRAKRSICALLTTAAAKEPIRIVNCHDEDGKLLEISKASKVALGEGSLGISDFVSCGYSRHTKTYTAVIGPAAAIPVRHSSARAAVGVTRPKLMPPPLTMAPPPSRNTSVSTIDLRSAALACTNDADDNLLHASPAATPKRDDRPSQSRSSSWGYVDPTQVAGSDVGDDITMPASDGEDVSESVADQDAGSTGLEIAGDDQCGDQVEASHDLPPLSERSVGGFTEELEAAEKESRETRAGGQHAGIEGDSDSIVVSAQWAEALQTMQEYEDDDAQAPYEPYGAPRQFGVRSVRSVRDVLAAAVSSRRSSAGTAKSGRWPEGYVDADLMEACRIAMMSASALDRRRRSGGSGGRCGKEEEEAVRMWV